MSGYQGWVKKNECGCIRKGRSWRYTDLRGSYNQLREESILAYPIDTFGRFNQASRIVLLSIALALHDADVPYAKNKKQDIGIVGTNPDGALASNQDYFRDYAACGRKLGRGNLFIYTLPSSPLAEASIHFGLIGPVLYVRHLARPGEMLRRFAESMLRDKEAAALITVEHTDEEAMARYHPGEKK